MKQIICPIIHGVEFDSGTFNSHYLSDMYSFIKNIQKYLSPEKVNQIHFRAINWNHLVAEKEDTIYKLLSDNFWQFLAKITAYGICDVIFYAPPKRTPQEGDLIYDIQKLVNEDIVKCQQVYGQDSDIVLIGHSLGACICLDFCFNGFIIDGLVTLGSPALLWSGRYHQWGDPPDHLNFWINFRSKFDPVATVMSRNPNDKFKTIITEIDTSSWLYMTPLRAHTHYWSSKIVHSQIARALSSLVS